MPTFYITADEIGKTSGGGLVTKQELTALQEFTNEKLARTFDVGFSHVEVHSRNTLGSNLAEPWKWDEVAVNKIPLYEQFDKKGPKVAHFYSGTFTRTVARLKYAGCKVAYTIAAHDKSVSRQEHEKLGSPFPYPHLTDPVLWKRYIEGYKQADLIVCPSPISVEIVKGYGPEFSNKKYCVIPHGCFLPEEGVKPLPSQFVVGYLGSFGADKGVRYLLEAWKELGYTDGSYLLLAGNDSTAPHTERFIAKYGGGCIHIGGWQKNIGSFYHSLALYVQPSATEGFGCEVMEAMAHGRPVLCSTGAGASSYLPASHRFASCNVKELINKIEIEKQHYLATKKENEGKGSYEKWVAIAQEHTWDKIREKYKQMWSCLLTNTY